MRANRRAGKGLQEGGRTGLFYAQDAGGRPVWPVPTPGFIECAMPVLRALEAVERSLRDLGSIDEEFLKEVQDGILIITEQLRPLRPQGATDVVTSSQLASRAAHVSH